MGYTCSTRVYYLKKVTPILLSVSVFSFLFYQDTPALLLHFISSLYAQLFSFTPQRKYIFLLFNGILILILATSGLINKIRPTLSGEKGVRTADHLKEIPARARIKVEQVVDVEVEGNEDHESNDTGDESGGSDEEMVMSMDELNRKCDDFIMRMKQEIQAA